jgi:phage gpG-like protein
MKFKSIKQLQKAFKKVAKDLITEKDLRDFASIQVRERKAGFDNGKAPDGSAWAPLKSSTVERKRRKQSPDPNKILVDEGKLRNTPPIRTTKNSAHIPIAKTRVEISKYHTDGTKNMPKREHWSFYDTAIEKINKRFTSVMWKRFKQRFQ